MEISWEFEIGQLLTELSGVQDELLEVLKEKRRCLATFDTAGMSELLPREEALGHRLADFQRRRVDLLERAAGAGLPAENLRSLAKGLPRNQRGDLQAATRDATIRARMLAQQGLANWVVVQRTLLHLSQLFEIIATGGKLKPTYGEGRAAQSSGSFVDQAA